jgi:hypothetical protein
LAEVADAGISGAPHWEQKRALRRTSALHPGQRRATGLPQLLQNRELIGFSVSQLEQRTVLLTRQMS